MEDLTSGQVVPNIPEGIFLRDGIEGLHSLPRHSVDMLLTDPPYGTTRNYWDVPLPLEEMWEAIRWAVKPNGAVLLFAQCPFDKVLGASNDGRRYPINVLYTPAVTGGIHPTQKPVELCEYFIKTYTDERAVVADICAGSGTTAVAALNTGRRFICFENAPAIYCAAAERIAKAQKALAEGRKGV